MSSSNDSWLYDTADVTWNVGSDGSIGTLYTNRGSGSFDAEWRYTGSASFTVNLDDYDSVTHGTDLTVKLVSDIENEATFATGVVFMRNGLDVSSDFSYDGIDTGSFTGTVAIPEPSSLILLGVGLVALSSFRKKE
jgi:hypothetical protein